ncbi:MAG: hypothetical protein JW973_12190 [Bacteroidales bacterium]|nr:hypothetical protein [Bacteroidales bacterium]
MKKSIHIQFVCKVLVLMVSAWLNAGSYTCGQSLTGGCDTLMGQQVPGSHLLCTPYRDLNPFNGLPGEINQWGPGTVYLQTGDSLSGRHLVYCSVGSNLLWTRNNKGIFLLVDKNTVKGFKLLSEKENRIICYEFFPMNNWYYTDGTSSFLEVLVKDSVSLYMLNTIEKFPMSDNLKAHKYYFIKRPGRDLDKIIPNRKSLCNALEYSEEFRIYLRNLHMRVNKKDRITRAVKEYNNFFKNIQR